MSSRPLLVAAAALLAARAAHADPGVAHTLGYPGVPDRGGTLPDPALHLELGLGLEVGSFELGQLGTPAFGGELRAGLRYGHLGLYAAESRALMDFPVSAPSVAAVGTPTVASQLPTWGTVRRDELFLRYGFGAARTIEYTKHSHRPIGIGRTEELVELGVGRELAALHPGGDTTRSLLSLGIGVTTSHHEDGRHVGVTLALRLLRAQADDGTVAHEVVLSFGVGFGT